MRDWTRREAHRLLLGWALFLAVGCAPAPGDLERAVAPQDDAFARAYLDTLLQGRYDRVIARVLPGLDTITGLADTLASVRRFLPQRDVKRPMLVGVQHVEPTPTVHVTHVGYELHGGGRFGVAYLGIAEELGLRYIHTLRAESLSAPLRQINALTLRGKGLGHYLALAVGTAALCFSLFMVFYVLDSKMPYRWLWASLALVGSSRIWFDWTTGGVQLMWLSVYAPVTILSRMGTVGHWILGLSLPFGAFVALERVRRWRRRQRSLSNPAASVRATEGVTQNV